VRRTIAWRIRKRFWHFVQGPDSERDSIMPWAVQSSLKTSLQISHVSFDNNWFSFHASNLRSLLSEYELWMPTKLYIVVAQNLSNTYISITCSWSPYCTICTHLGNNQVSQQFRAKVKVSAKMISNSRHLLLRECTTVSCTDKRGLAFSLLI
jgi:hypothetical protein